MQKTNINRFVKLLFVAASLFFSACYSFKGFSIDQNVTSFYVTNVENKTALASPTLAQDFTERMRDRVRNETRLKYNDTAPDIEFSGAIIDYKVTAEAPRPGEGSSLNRLTMVVEVAHTNNKDEKLSYKQSFQFSDTFEANTNLSSVQDDLNKRIMNQIITDIILKTFNNW